MREKPGTTIPPRPAQPLSGIEDSAQSERSYRELLCARCFAPITRESALCEINSDSEHRCLNPVGIYYHIRCFREAPGCRVCGLPVEEYSWFPGYCWQLAVCGRCETHLGWFFSASTPVFFGLISNSLVTPH